MEITQYGYINVDTSRGNDLTAKRDCMSSPFKTLKAAFKQIQDSDTVLIQPGVYTENPMDTDNAPWTLPDYGAPLVIRNRRDVTVQGIGRPQIKFTAHNNGLNVENCVDCRFKDFSYSGQGYKIKPPGRYYSLFLFNGVNTGHVVENVYGSDSGDHLLAHLFGPRTIFNTTVKNCRFYRCGQMITGSPWPDGVAVGLGGYGNRVQDCYFEECNRVIEVESGTFPNDETQAKRIWITGNQIVRPWAHPILITPINGKANNYAQMIISQNIIQGWGKDPAPAFGGHWAPCGMWITGISGGIITENIITDLWDGSALQIEAANCDVSDLIIANNEFQRIGRTAISLTVTDWKAQGATRENFKLQHCRVMNNLVRDCQGRAIWINGSYVTVDSNTLINSDYAGIWEDGGVGNVYKNNRLFDCGGATVPGRRPDGPLEIPYGKNIDNEVNYISKLPPGSSNGTN